MPQPQTCNILMLSHRFNMCTFNHECIWLERKHVLSPDIPTRKLSELAKVVQRNFFSDKVHRKIYLYYLYMGYKQNMAKIYYRNLSIAKLDIFHLEPNFVYIMWLLHPTFLKMHLVQINGSIDGLASSHTCIFGYVNSEYHFLHIFQVY